MGGYFKPWGGSNIFLGDFNGHHTELWGSNFTNQRGQFVAELAAHYSLEIAGEGLTYKKHKVCSSTLDLGLVPVAWTGMWKRIVSDHSWGSDHHPWILQFQGASRPLAPIRQPNWNKFRHLITQRLQATDGDHLDLDQEQEWVATQLKAAFNNSLQTMLEIGRASCRERV